MKATAETYWVNQETKNVNFVSEVVPGKWFCKAKQTLRHLFLQDISRSNLKSISGVWDMFILRQQQRSGITEKATKDEFFYGNHRASRKNIYHRAWQRHSAYLVYQQKVNTLQRGKGKKTDYKVEAENDETTVSNTRLSFQVESIRQLPVWAVSLNEMHVIEDELSSLCLMEIRSCGHINADAA